MAYLSKLHYKEATTIASSNLVTVVVCYSYSMDTFT